uniref:C-type lectin domain-containing protein n=1 Tax=Plectus sambesii TaxID=2011161 RepID=A0A914XD59_9BILA
MVLTSSILPVAVNCDQTCDAIGLRCMHDSMPLMSFNEYFVKEWFYITGTGSVCDNTVADAGNRFDDSARGTEHYPMTFIGRGFDDDAICYGWKQPVIATEASKCWQVTKPVNYRSLCFCADTGLQTSKLSKEWTQLTSTYVKAMKFQNSSLFRWTVAENLCQLNFSATLPSIRNQAENDELLAFARAQFGGSGLVWLNWRGKTWMDSGMRMSSYQNWEQPMPLASMKDGWNAALNLLTGKWVYFDDLATNTAFVVCRLLDFYRWTTNAAPEPPSFTQRSGTKIATGKDANPLSDTVTSSAYDCVKLCSKNIQCMSATYQTTGSKCRLFPIYTPSRALYATYNITETNADYTLFDRVISKYLL